MILPPTHQRLFWFHPKSFNTDGSLFFPADRAFFEGVGTGDSYGLNDGLNIPFIGNMDPSDISPVWNPEAFFNTMVVNGKTWPYLDVVRERYRFRLLNAADSVFLNLSLRYVDPATNTQIEIPFYLIGTDQSLLPQVVRIKTGSATPLPGGGIEPADIPTQNPDRALLMGPAERMDVIVDFSNVPVGAKVVMYNTGPDAPFGGFPIPAPDIANPATTGQLMQFRVQRRTSANRGSGSTKAAGLKLDTRPGGVALLTGSGKFQDLALLEEVSARICVDPSTLIETAPISTDPLVCDAFSSVFGPKAAVLGVNGSSGGTSQFWMDPITQNPAFNAVEDWQLWNWSMDAHPIHLHLVKFQVVSSRCMRFNALLLSRLECGYV